MLAPPNRSTHGWKRAPRRTSRPDRPPPSLLQQRRDTSPIGICERTASLDSRSPLPSPLPPAATRQALMRQKCRLHPFVRAAEGGSAPPAPSIDHAVLQSQPFVIHVATPSATTTGADRCGCGAAWCGDQRRWPGLPWLGLARRPIRLRWDDDENREQNRPGAVPVGQSCDPMMSACEDGGGLGRVIDCSSCSRRPRLDRSRCG